MLDLLKDTKVWTILFAIVFYIIVRTISDRLLAKRNNLSVRFIGNLCKTGALIFGFFLILSQFENFRGFITSLLANSALVVAVLGFALQNVIRNLLAGILLIQSDAFKIGDRVRLSDKNITGVIEEMNLHYTVIKLYTNERAIVPNYVMNETVVINNDKKDSTTSYPISFYIRLDKDLDKVIDIIKEQIIRHHLVLNKEDTKVTLAELSTTYVEVKAFIWTRDIEESFITVSALRLDIIKALQKHDLISVETTLS
ncbi:MULTISPECIES: mechanosensitive ion channel family protein [unclassified Granulicatella]|uniref:mechanosensitive ion channel family protein n=1 Tax=unclassified Granulicatella TaxID=2630493 RepID=UPI0013D0C8B8|nr:MULTISPECIES: mechanosensitive ion channel domain-containing protein [unclassified Granulicatella]MBS4750172.1 mechanosensitive ion channel [Carnobacteriaceae bacterium zg-ZUI78]QMI85629.1 mechanosensitive ion channel [Carnobacteriaceae bacterium zg-84]